MCACWCQYTYINLSLYMYTWIWVVTIIHQYVATLQDYRVLQYTQYVRVCILHKAKLNIWSIHRITLV